MATTQNNYTGNGSNKLFSITFPYLDTADIDVFLNGTLQTVTTQYTFANATTIEFVAAPANGAAVRIDRSTDDSALAATFFPGSSIKAADLNADFDQTLYVVQEINNKAVKLDDPLYVNKTYIDNADALKVTKAGDSMSGILAMGTNKITGLGNPTNAQDAATKTYVDAADALKVAKAGDTMSGNLAMGGNKVTGLGTPSASADAVTKSYLDAYINTAYLGPLASDPAVRPSGGALQAGDIYFNTTQNILKAYTGSIWVISAAAGNIVRWRKTASAGNTTLSGVDDLGVTLSYVVGNEQVYLNGALQTRGVDYTAGTGTSITLTPALLAGDVVELHAVQGYVSATITPGSINDALVAPAAGIQATKLAFTQAGTGATARTVDSKLKDVVSVKDFGAVGDGVTNDTVAIQAALDSGAAEVVIPPGTYSVTGLEIKTGSALRTLRGSGFPVIRLVTGASRIALLISKAQFLQVEHIEFDSSGTKSDGNSTVGIKAVSKSYMAFKRLRFTDFSLRAMQIQQCVYWELEDITINGCTYGLSFEKNAGVQCTAVTVRGAYISNCSRGIFMDGAVTMQFESCIMEYCGETGTTEGAFHAAGGVATLLRCYWEANNRNIVSADALITLITPNELAGTAANSFTYSGTAFDLRGTTSITSYEIRTPRIKPDNKSAFDLTIGENLIVPLAGGSVEFGKTTTETVTGLATASTWTTVKAIPATEMTGTSGQKAAYFYTLYVGYADLSTGFDFGTIFNDTLRSFTGTTPAWLRLNTQNIQVNIASSSYGLYYRLVLHRIFPGAL